MMGRNPIGGFFSGGLFGSTSSSSSPRAESSQEHDDDDVTNKEQESPRESQSSGWNFGGFMKTIAEKSGGVLQTYQHDLKEFGIGLKKETEVITGATAHVVKDLPSTLETGATVAQESLETVGQTLEVFGSTVWKGTTEIFAQVKEVLTVDEDAEGNSGLESYLSTGDSSASHSNTKYSRYESQVHAMQRDSSTYYDEPEDENDFASWVATFNLDDRKGEIEQILATSPFMKELQNQIVPSLVEYDTFWTRYFYRLNKLQQIENARVKLVKRAIDGEEDEDLSWDVDEEKDEEIQVDEPVVPAGTVVQDNKPNEIILPTRSVEDPLVSSAEDVHDEEEVKSEGSAGSEWLVVSEGKGSGSSEPKTSPSSPVSERKETESSTPKKPEDHEVNEAELDQLGDLSLGDGVEVPVQNKEEEKKVSTLKDHDVTNEENEEDWGEWE
ncbi:uncharacterized protein [Physcomitrium patens]|uniref:BSD domain-containing protein n=1 Tax=Physcomitrium patens TaxID=3218 RepID=A0A2K1L1V8_PHYPA|nr:BSD domain-containing protein 1-like [Physcomitrium patens]PNR60017.1 hypothetical protein PHYPA_002809 [Physcomitrium patens]|eukprot:XP_024368711.1 BSD domain-containing protein 1-like [Physcomitrella patens]